MHRNKIVWLLQEFFKLSRKRQVTLCVWSLHFLILLSLLIHHAAIRSFKPSRPIAIRTIAPQKSIAVAPAPQKTKTPAVEPPGKSQKSSPPPAKAQTAPKKASPPPAQAKTKAAPSESIRKSAPSKTPKENSMQDLAAALKALDSLDNSTASNRTKLEVPSLIHIQPPNARKTAAPSYSEFLISYLQESLDLPEYGEVKIKLLIGREGNLLESTILASENAKNSEFLKNRLPELSFPCFNDFDIHENCLTFTVSFVNAENPR